MTATNWPQASAQPEVRASVLNVRGLTLPLALATGGITSADSWSMSCPPLASSAAKRGRSSGGHMRSKDFFQKQQMSWQELPSHHVTKSSAVLSTFLMETRAPLWQRMRNAPHRPPEAIGGCLCDRRSHRTLAFAGSVSDREQTCCSGLRKGPKVTERPPPNFLQVIVVRGPRVQQRPAISPQPCTQASLCTWFGLDLVASCLRPRLS